MFTRASSRFVSILLLLPVVGVCSARGNEPSGAAIAQALLEAYAPQPRQTLSNAANPSPDEALSRASAILNNLAAESAPSGLPPVTAANPPAQAVEGLQKLQQVLDELRRHQTPQNAPPRAAATPLIHPQELVEAFGNPLPPRDLRSQLKSAAKSHPDNPVVWLLRAYHERQLGHAKKSQAALERALSQLPADLIPEPLRTQLQEEGIPMGD